MNASHPSLVRDLAVECGDRRLGVALFGSEQGLPVIYQHGLPGSRLEAGLVAEAARQNDLKLVAIDRPGYGVSDPRPGRSLASWASDVAVVADFLKLNRFALLGVSGGALYA
ncbi:MAG: alpha/beta hydrolase, partial [Deltaproteobacteria bacterium]